MSTPQGLTLTVTVVVDPEKAQPLSGSRSIAEMVTEDVRAAILSAPLSAYLSQRNYACSTVERPAVLVGLNLRS